TLAAALRRMRRPQVRPELIAVPIVQDDERAYEIGSLRGSTPVSAVALGTVRRIHRLRRFRGLWIDDRLVERTGTAADGARHQHVRFREVVDDLGEFRGRAARAAADHVFDDLLP